MNAVEDIKSFRTHVDMEITTPDEHVVMVVDVETGQDGRVRSVLEVAEAGDKQSVEMIIALHYVYVKVPDAGWTQMSGQDHGRIIGPVP